MLLSQIKKPIILTTSAFLIIVLLSSNIQVQAENADKTDKAHTLWEHGKNAFNERDYPTALEKFNNSLALYREIEDLQSEADLLTWLAATNKETNNDTAKALNYLKESQEIYNKLHSKPGEKAHFKDVDKTIKVLVLCTEGKQCLDAKDFESTIKKLNEALQLTREMGITQYEAELLVGIVSVYAHKEVFSKSLSKINEALRIFEQINDKEGMASAFNWAGRVNYGLSKYSTALDYYKKALALYEESGDKKEKAFIAKWLGQTHKSLGSYDISLKYFKQALDIIQEIGIPPQEGYILLQIAEVYSLVGNYLEALNAYNKAMQIFKELNNLTKQGNVLVGIGKVHSDLGNYLEAVENLQKALEIFEDLEESQDLKGYIHLGRKDALNALSKVYALIGSKEKAAEYDLKSKNLYQWDEKNKSYQWLNLFGQGQDLEKGGNPDKALEIYQQALDLSKEMSNKYCEAISLSRIGDIYNKLKEYPKAIEFYMKGLEVSREQNHKIGELSALTGIANSYIIQSDFINALDYYQHELKIAKETGSKTFEIDSLGGVGLASLGQKNYKMAEEYYKKALIKSKEIDAPGRIWTYNHRLGRVAYHSEQLQKAKSYFSEAINTIESIREKISLEEYKTSFVENKLNVYHAMITVLLLLKEDEEAFNYVERAKSRSLLA